MSRAARGTLPGLVLSAPGCLLVSGPRGAHQLAFLRQYQQHVLIRQEYELSAAVAPALPFPVVGQFEIGSRPLASWPISFGTSDSFSIEIISEPLGPEMFP